MRPVYIDKSEKLKKIQEEAKTETEPAEENIITETEPETDEEPQERRNRVPVR